MHGAKAGSNRRHMRHCSIGLIVLASSSASALLLASPTAHKSAVRHPRAVVQAALPSTTALATACVAPTLLGFWKSEYGVSYAYGFAMAASGAMYLGRSTPPLVMAHALCLVAYGVRLNLFLLYRELTIPRFSEFREKIEARAVERGSRLARAPFVLSCSLLYFCMAASLRLTAPLAAGAAPAPAVAALRLLVGLMWAGFGVAAVGDATKTYVKARRGADHLVTGGVFAALRHPNYTGEALLWSANAAAAAVAAAAGGGGKAAARLARLGWLGASLVGAAGILFVLMGAAGSLEARQAETHGGTPEYEAWRRRSWQGPALQKKPAPPQPATTAAAPAAAAAAEGDAV